MRKEAYAWVARLKDANGAADREKFQRWLETSPEHKLAYDEVAASYDASGVLRTSGIGRSRSLESAFPTSTQIVRRSLAFTAIAAVLVAGAYEIRSSLGLIQPVAIESVMLASGTDSKSVTLADGSKIVMGPLSEVRIDLGRKQRLAEIRKGRLRLIIAHDARPFRLVAGSASIEARAGTFDAAFVGGSGSVGPASAGPPLPGGAAQSSAIAKPVAAEQSLEFDGEPLRSAIMRINQAGLGPPIELDPRLDTLRVTGVFKRQDSRAIARSLALAFGVDLDPTSSGTLFLTPEK